MLIIRYLQTSGAQVHRLQRHKLSFSTNRNVRFSHLFLKIILDEAFIYETTRDRTFNVVEKGWRISIFFQHCSTMIRCASLWLSWLHSTVSDISVILKIQIHRVYLTTMHTKDLEVGWRWNVTRCWSRIWWNLLSVVYTTPEQFEHTASFLRWGLPFTLIPHENRAFQKRSSNRRNLETPALRFSADLKTVFPQPQF